MNEVQRFYGGILSGISVPLIEKMSNNSVIRTYEKGQTLIAQGERLQWVMFLINGVVRSVSRDDAGQEVTLALLYEYGDCLVPHASFHQTSFAAIEAITMCNVACIPISYVKQLVEEEPEAQNQYIRYMRRACDYYAEIHVALGRHQSAEKYKWFVHRFSEIIDIVPDKYIASLLDMTPVTLSRVRRKIREERLRRTDLHVSTDTTVVSKKP